MKITPGSGLVVGPPKLSEFNFAIDVQEGSTVISQPTTEPAVDLDANVLRSFDAVVDNYFLATLHRIAGDASDLDNVVLSIEGSAGSLSGSRVSRVSDGTVRIVARHPFLRRSKTVTLTRTNGFGDQFVDFVDGSLAKHIWDAVVSRATGKTAANLGAYSLLNYPGPVYRRNVNFWLKDIDLTACSPWNSYDGAFRAGVAISPRHIIFARHYPIADGAMLHFVTMDNQVVTRQLVGQSATDGAWQYDTIVGVLDSDLPASIKPMKLWPADVDKYLPTVSKYFLPVCAFDQEEKVITQDLQTLVKAGDNYTLNFGVCQTAPQSVLSEPVVGGDSGNPIFTIIGGEAVLISTWLGYTTGPAQWRFLDAINTAMTTLGGGYQVQTVDLSTFNNYG